MGQERGRQIKFEPSGKSYHYALGTQSGIGPERLQHNLQCVNLGNALNVGSGVSDGYFIVTMCNSPRQLTLCTLQTKCTSVKVGLGSSQWTSRCN